MTLFKYTITTLFLTCLLYSSASYAAQKSPDADEFYLNKLNFCTITKETKNDYEPEDFSTSNNLLRKPGQDALFCGERIIVHGRILDQNCVPISDAKVHLWQVGCNGKYSYKPLKNNIDDNMFEENPGMTFLGNGTATTNNKGEFYFVTLYPVEAHGMPSHVNFRVKHTKFDEEHDFVMKLQGHRVRQPALNPELSRIAPIAAEMGSKIYDFDIVVDEQVMDYF